MKSPGTGGTSLRPCTGMVISRDESVWRAGGTSSYENPVRDRRPPGHGLDSIHGEPVCQRPGIGTEGGIDVVGACVGSGKDCEAGFARRQAGFARRQASWPGPWRFARRQASWPPHQIWTPLPPALPNPAGQLYWESSEPVATFRRYYRLGIQ